MNAPVSAMSGALDQLRSMATQAGGRIAPNGGAGVDEARSAGGGDFASMLKASLDKVSTSQTQSLAQAHAFETGNSDASLSDVMVDMQKANIQFQTAVQVRNKMVSAYNDIMQMQV